MGLKSLFQKKKPEAVAAPLAGALIPASEIEDPTFADQILGMTIGIRPAEGRIVAPMDGVVTSVFDTRHAVCLTAKSGAELLIHVGIDTVSLNGAPFTAHIADGAAVRQGDLLLTFDPQAITDAGLSTTTIVVLTNADAFPQAVPAAPGPVQAGDPILLFHS